MKDDRTNLFKYKSLILNTENLIDEWKTKKFYKNSSFCIHL